MFTWRWNDAGQFSLKERHREEGSKGLTAALWCPLLEWHLVGWFASVWAENEARRSSKAQTRRDWINTPVFIYWQGGCQFRFVSGINAGWVSPRESPHKHYSNIISFIWSPCRRHNQQNLLKCHRRKREQMRSFQDTKNGPPTLHQAPSRCSKCHRNPAGFSFQKLQVNTAISHFSAVF